MTKRIIVIKRANKTPTLPVLLDPAQGDAEPDEASSAETQEQHSLPPRLKPGRAWHFESLISPLRRPVSWAIIAGAATCLIAVAWMLTPTSPGDRQTTAATGFPSPPASVPARRVSPPLDRAGSIERSSPPAPADAAKETSPAFPAPPAHPQIRTVRPKFPDAFRGTVTVHEPVVATASKPSPLGPSAQRQPHSLRPAQDNAAGPIVPPAAQISALESFYGVASLRREASRRLGPPTLSKDRRSDTRLGASTLDADLSSPASETVPPVSTDRVRPLGLRYTFEDSGQRHPPRPTLTVEANQDAYLYVWTQGPDGDWHRMSPPEHAGEDAARVEKGKRYVLSTKDSLSLGMDKPDPVLIVLSRLPQPDVEAPPVLSPSPLGAEPPSSGGGNEQLLREEADEPTAHGSYERAVYVVETEPHPSSHLAIAPR